MRYTILRAERQEGKRERGEDLDVKKYVEMLNQAGFEAALSHSNASILHPSIREIMFRGPPILGTKRLLSNRLLQREPEELSSEAG